MSDPVREAFEAYMRKQNVCTRLERQSEAVGGEYRTVTVERAWQIWQAALAAPVAPAARQKLDELFKDRPAPRLEPNDFTGKTFDQDKPAA